jgi:hypothetical protein
MVVLLFFAKFDISPRMKRVGLEWCGLETADVLGDLYVEQEVEPRAREGKEEGSALLALDAGLAVKVTAFGLGSGVSSQTR